MSRDCTLPKKAMACYTCGEEGHTTRNCPQQESSRPKANPNPSPSPSPSPSPHPHPHPHPSPSPSPNPNPNPNQVAGLAGTAPLGRVVIGVPQAVLHSNP